MNIHRIIHLVPAIICGFMAQAQEIDLSLHATATPDSFEVRATATSGEFITIPNAVFTLRWELASGGVANNGDVRRPCPAFPLYNYGGTVDIGAYRYMTLVMIGDRWMGDVGCSIGVEGTVLCGVRIREMSGCRSVSLVQNAYTGMNNLDYFFSVGGIDATGSITSAPITAGDCAPCEPPVITGTPSLPVPYCGIGVDMSVTAAGSQPMDHAWRKPNGTLFGWLQHMQVHNAPAGLYSVVVSNLCGSDTAEVAAIVDPDACVAPRIDSVWWESPQSPSIYVLVALVGSCPSFVWHQPSGLTTSNTSPWLLVNNPLEGTYTVVATNECGSDTMSIVIDPPMPCIPPTIESATITSDHDCGPATFTAHVSGFGPLVSQAWYAPSGSLLATGPTLTTPFAPWGTYMFIVSNPCGPDTMEVLHMGSDTTGLSTCTPPQILSTGPGGAACERDTAVVFATYSSSGPCTQLQWTGAQVLSIHGDSARVVLDGEGPIQLTVTNACGQDTALLPLFVQRMVLEQARFCRPPTAPLSLDSMVSSSLPPEGQWYHNGFPHGPFYDTAVDTTGYFYYHVELEGGVVCPAVRLMVQELPRTYAGEDSSVVVCSADPPFALVDMLGGDPMLNGWWRYQQQPTAPTFDPANDAGGVYTYTVSAGLGTFCNDYALLSIEVEAAIAWYVDTDGDGLGDPLDSLLSCDPITGYVTAGGDACPQLIGTVGDPCDDGDPETTDETISEDCACIGGMGIGEAGGAGGWHLWPNPSRGVVQLRGPIGRGTVGIRLLDAAGRLVSRTERTMTSGTITLTTDELAAGIYQVQVLAHDRTQVLRLIVE